MKDYTDEFSFVLKPSKNGVGVFCTHAIKKDTKMQLLGKSHDDYCERKREDVPDNLRMYCLQYENKFICPKDFGRMSMEWYVNHSSDATIYTKDGVTHFAKRDLNEDEEITIDYNSFKESESAKEEYYSS